MSPPPPVYAPALDLSSVCAGGVEVVPLSVVGSCGAAEEADSEGLLPAAHGADARLPLGRMEGEDTYEGGDEADNGKGGETDGGVTRNALRFAVSGGVTGRAGGVVAGAAAALASAAAHRAVLARSRCDRGAKAHSTKASRAWRAALPTPTLVIDLTSPTRSTAASGPTRKDKGGDCSAQQVCVA